MSEYTVLPAGYRTEVAVLTGPLLLRSVGGPDGGGPGLFRHRTFWRAPGRVPAGRLLELVQKGGITGRGGADFPFWRKLEVALASGRKRELVVNGSEGEPASAKDGTLLVAVPHLVLDGAELVARALGVPVVHVVLPGARPAVIDAVRRAVDERPRSGIDFELHATSGGFVGGQSRAVLELLSGRPNLPVTSYQPEAVSGLRGRPTLMSNAETFAQVAALNVVGLEEYTRVGTAQEPGTRLLSVAADGPGGVVVEVPHGSGLAEVLTVCGYEPDQPVLIGGYHGSWLSAEQVRQAVVSTAGMIPVKARIGAGTVLPMLAGDCPVVYTAQIVTYLSTRRAQRCGPCIQGLPALAQACERLARGEPDTGSAPLSRAQLRAAGAAAPATPTGRRASRTGTNVARIRELCQLVAGRGACQHPDGTARLVLSMLDTFPAEVAAHQSGRCTRQLDPDANAARAAQVR